MPIQRRKKPPDPISLSLQSFPCLPHEHPSDLPSSSICHFLQIFDLGKRFGLVFGSLRNLARPRDGVLVGLGVWPYNRRWVATHSAFSCRSRSVYGASVWLPPHGRCSCAACLGPKVRATIRLIPEISCSRITARHGKGVLGGLYTSRVLRGMTLNLSTCLGGPISG